MNQLISSVQLPFWSYLPLTLAGVGLQWVGGKKGILNLKNEQKVVTYFEENEVYISKKFSKTHEFWKNFQKQKNLTPQQLNEFQKGSPLLRCVGTCMTAIPSLAIALPTASVLGLMGQGVVTVIVLTPLFMKLSALILDVATCDKAAGKIEFAHSKIAPLLIRFKELLFFSALNQPLTVFKVCCFVLSSYLMHQYQNRLPKIMISQIRFLHEYCREQKNNLFLDASTRTIYSFMQLFICEYFHTLSDYLGDDHEMLLETLNKMNEFSKLQKSNPAFLEKQKELDDLILNETPWILHYDEESYFRLTHTTEQKLKQEWGAIKKQVIHGLD